MKNRRQVLERELAQKQSLLKNAKLINRLPDKGQRIMDQIELIQQQLKQYENQNPEETLKEEEQLNELSESFTKKIQVSSQKEKQETIQKQNKKTKH
jgi:CHASE3 domain sensor protein